ncbi:MAG TPA: hypothetical protein VMU84_21125 [Thermoanaerobaculia bacterium]|nr:hypothetical protein [Thermoanaerobaculia bacterium]
MTDRFLARKTIALSVSDSPDLARLGMSPRALDHAVIEIARYLLRAGATIAYGGDLRDSGFTIALFELVRRYRRDDPDAPPLRNYLAWSVHQRYEPAFIESKRKEYTGAAKIILLDRDGDDATQSLTSMRRRMAADTHARVLLGGKVTGFSGAYPGIAEEAAVTLEQNKALLLAGGFGGCTRDIASWLGFGGPWERSLADVGAEWQQRYFAGMEQVKSAQIAPLPDENHTLADCRNLPQIIRLVLQALARLP